jgi:hypothetical protein
VKRWGQSTEDEARMKWCIPENGFIFQQHGMEWRLLGSYEDLIDLILSV